MAQADKDGYIFYPGLTGFPCTLGHELSGIVRDFGPGAKNKATNKPFKGGEAVCAEEMVWCGACQPCADGFPNHCERLDEIGFNINGAFTKYIVLPDRLLWSLDPLREKFSGQDIFRLGSMVEPTCVAYTGVIVRGGVARGEPGQGLGGKDRWKKFDEAKLDELLDKGESRTAFLLRFTLTHPHCHTTIVGTMKPEHLMENVRIAQQGPLPADVYAEAKRRLDSVGVSPEA